MPMYIKTKVTLTTFSPKSHGQSEYEKSPLVLGVLFGEVNGVFKRELPNGIAYEGLKGHFRAVISNLANGPEAAVQDPNTVQVSSGICYLPEAFQGPLADLVDDAENNGVVRFGYRVCIAKADNPAGYEWLLDSLIPASVSDPITNLIATSIGSPGSRDAVVPKLVKAVK